MKSGLECTYVITMVTFPGSCSPIFILQSNEDWEHEGLGMRLVVMLMVVWVHV